MSRWHRAARIGGVGRDKIEERNESSAIRMAFDVMARARAGPEEPWRTCRPRRIVLPGPISVSQWWSRSPAFARRRRVRRSSGAMVRYPARGFLLSRMPTRVSRDATSTQAFCSVPLWLDFRQTGLVTVLPPSVIV